MDEDLQKSFIELMNKKRQKSKTITLRDFGNAAKHDFICEDFTYMQQSNNPEKYLIFERLRTESVDANAINDTLAKDDVEYRISYYVVSRKPNSKAYGRWVFGQYCTMIPAADFTNLIAKAKKENVFIEAK